ncbi:hypothetical protein CERSUDRAFT_123532 [Gelatoporia subvermispora B]|uniref:DUF6533 domain-containing protein n=1 Tax=Ceriporiopsis subvermispora (strain B) TaxID=914234 RepID=M2PMK4_CERS8|nr:hypothetical protein CERSUDRAFT_123532 [Gelatoporia subvermispora B]
MVLHGLNNTELLQGVQISRFFVLAPLTILYYDYVLMFATEVDVFWRRVPGISCASVLFIANRYLGLVGSIPIIVEFFGYTSQAFFALHLISDTLETFHQYFAVTTQAIAAVRYGLQTRSALLIMRTFALYNRDLRILLLMIAATVVGGAIAIWSIDTDTSNNDMSLTTFGALGCNLSLSTKQARHLAGAWSSMLGLDTIIFILTVVRVVHFGPSMKRGMLRLMLRDGTMYYGLIVIAGIANTVTFMVGLATTQGLCTTLTNVASSTLVSRLMLNLRDSDRKPMRLDGQTVQTGDTAWSLVSR